MVPVHLLMPIRWESEEEQEIHKRQTNLWLFQGSHLSWWPGPWVSWLVRMLVYQCNHYRDLWLESNMKPETGCVPSVWLVISAYCPSFCSVSEKVMKKTMTLAHVWSCWMEPLKSSSFFYSPFHNLRWESKQGQLQQDPFFCLLIINIINA